MNYTVWAHFFWCDLIHSKSFLLFVTLDACTHIHQMIAQYKLHDCNCSTDELTNLVNGSGILHDFNKSSLRASGNAAIRY